MSKKISDFPCKCGHYRVNHLVIAGRLPAPNTYRCAVGYCECLNFDADNLKYLEKQYESRDSN